nr:hypothetical protein [Kordiimonas gwangyangensis]
MGTSARQENVELCITALADALNRHQHKADADKALKAARDVLAA